MFEVGWMDEWVGVGVWDGDVWNAAKVGWKFG